MFVRKADTLHVDGAVSPDSLIIIVDMIGDRSVMFNAIGGDFAGDLRFPNGLLSGVVTIDGRLTGSASVDLNGQELYGQLSLTGGSAEGSEINAGPLTGLIELRNGEYRGSVTVASIEETFGAAIAMYDAALIGSINVLGDCKMWLRFADRLHLQHGSRGNGR
jgi:hypothetical protein